MIADDRVLEATPAPYGLAAVIAAAPDGAGGVMVTIASLDAGSHRHGPCIGWAPRPDARAPQRGDRAVVLPDDTGQLWILSWRPTP